MIEPLWINSAAALFWWQDSNPVRLLCVDIEKISWKNPRETRMVLRGTLPAARALLKIADGDTLELLYSECGIPSDYYAEDVIMSFSNCIIKRKWIPGSATMHSRQEEVITVYVSLECELRIDQHRGD